MITLCNFQIVERNFSLPWTDITTNPHYLIIKKKMLTIQEQTLQFTSNKVFLSRES